MDSESLREEYLSNGFVHLRGFFDPVRVAEIREEACRLFARQMMCLGHLDESGVDDESAFNAALYAMFEHHPEILFNCGKQAQHLTSLHCLSLDRTLLNTMQSLGLSWPVISTRPVLYFNHRKLATKPVYHTVPPHQDWRSMQGSINAAVAWVPLMDIPRSLGGLRVIPGSHKNGLVSESFQDGFGYVEIEDESRFVDVETQCGDVLIFSAFLVHGSGDNTTDTPRWSCHFRYNDLDEPSFVERGYPHPYAYYPRDEVLTPEFPINNHAEMYYK
ncbi:phytanoyl-CoA dioxygenase family protein [Halomonas organivorans]